MCNTLVSTVSYISQSPINFSFTVTRYSKLVNDNANTHNNDNNNNDRRYISGNQMIIRCKIIDKKRSMMTLSLRKRNGKS